MHYHCEIIMPPTDCIEDAVASIMKPYDEQGGDDEDGMRKHAFWDWYVIGGRSAGRKAEARIGADKIEAFEQWCKDEHITISGLTCGKQKLQPENQIPKVDAKWNEMFPSEKFMPCPLFDHSNDQYGRDGIRSGTIDGDICTLADLPEDLTCERVIIAGPSGEKNADDEWTYTGPLKAEFMLTDTAWNGCNHMPVDWDEKVSSAVAAFRKRLTGYSEQYRAVMMPQGDWLVVTVDYHS